MISEALFDIAVFVQISPSASNRLRQILPLGIGSIQNATSLRVSKRRRGCSSLILIVTRGIFSLYIALWLSLLGGVLHSGLHATTRYHGSVSTSRILVRVRVCQWIVVFNVLSTWSTLHR